MERDIRRDRSQWRGCHFFQDIICDGDEVAAQKRNGGLKMGQTYYYYYEVDGAIETHDPTKPTTNACPYLPGQTVNTLDVPMVQPSRMRSASMNSLCVADFMTMNPSDKFTTPRAVLPVSESFGSRVGTSPSVQPTHKQSARSLSPNFGWADATRRLFGLRSSSRGSDSGTKPDVGFVEDARSTKSSNLLGTRSAESNRLDRGRSTTPCGSVRSRDMSPESLRKFFADDAPGLPLGFAEPKISIPEEIIEENEDDDNFATSAVSESIPFTTLSPPPFQRSFSVSSITGNKNDSSATIIPQTTFRDATTLSESSIRNSTSSVKVEIPHLNLSFSATSSSLASPTSPQSTTSRDPSSCFDDSNDDDDDDDDLLSNDDCFNFPLPPNGSNDEESAYQPFASTSLPQSTTDNPKHPTTVHTTNVPLGSPALIARNDSGLSIGLVSRTVIDTGLDDLVSELGWIANVI